MHVGSQRRILDAIVVGIGAMGSAALYHLARRGLHVLGLEAHGIPNSRGASYGHSRIIRLAYYQHPGYVPLARRALTLWQELQDRSGSRLLTITGSVDAGPLESPIVYGSILSCIEHDLPHAVLSAQALGERFPGYQLPPATVAVLQPEGGILCPTRCIRAHTMIAVREGARVHVQERVLGWTSEGELLRVWTDRSEHRTRHIVVTAGGWATELLPGLAGVVRLDRQVALEFEPKYPALLEAAVFPVFNASIDGDHYYGAPAWHDAGFKFGRAEYPGRPTSAGAVERVSDNEECVLRLVAERLFPAGTGRTISRIACAFDNTTDGHFLIDLEATDPRVVIAAGFSGHGFKFASVVGEILADLVEHGSTVHDITLFRRRQRVHGQTSWTSVMGTAKAQSSHRRDS